MDWVAINCPQCSAPLPRVALWRAVKCGSCGALIAKNESLVLRGPFQQALARANRASLAPGRSLACGGQRYHLLHHLGDGEVSQVYVARRAGALPLLATLKLSSAPRVAVRYAREAQVLRQLQGLQSPDAPYFTQRLPQLIAQGVVGSGVDGSDTFQQALVLQHPNGYWGSLAALNHRFASGMDGRHIVWMWRRMLEVLRFIHRHRWCHGDVRPEHALVHPKDHGILLVGWTAAHDAASAEDQASDLCRSARVMQVLLAGASEMSGIPPSVPASLADLITHAADDLDFSRAQGAKGLESLLTAAAVAAYGPPQFVPLHV